MEEKLYVTTVDIVHELGVSESFALKLIRKMNGELAEKGFDTVDGRVRRSYYGKRVFGL